MESTIETDRLQQLSFVTGWPESQKPRTFWNVQPTGDYATDTKIGRELALEYLAHEEAAQGSPGNLIYIVQDMPSTFTGIEIGFLTLVSYAAGAGADQARQTSTLWSAKLAGLAD